MFGKKVLMCAAVFAMSSLMSACDSDDDDTSVNPDGTSRPFGTIDGTDGSANAPSGITGTWVRACTADDPSDAETEYSTSVAVFTTESASITDNAYTDSGCTVAAGPAVFVIDYSLEFPGGTTATSLGDAAHINVTPESATIDGQPLSGVFASFVDLNKTQYDLLLIANDMLYAGDTDGDLDGSSEATRPDALDTEFVYIRE